MQPPVLEGAHAEAVHGQPAAAGGPGGARGIDGEASAQNAQLVVQLEPRCPSLRLGPGLLPVGEPRATHQVETDQDATLLHGVFGDCPAAQRYQRYIETSRYLRE